MSRCLAESGTVTLRKRRLPLEMMVWCIVGMALERKEPLHQIVNRLTSCRRAIAPSLPPVPLFRPASAWK
ncbi:transposase domain-containing protein [Shigella flexneri]